MTDRQIEIQRDAVSVEPLAEAGRYHVVASSPDIARDGMRIPTGSWSVENYRRNPVLLWSHNRDDVESVIGRAEVDIQTEALVADIEFAPEGVNPKADQVRRLWEAGLLGAVSVGASVHKAREVDGVIEVERAELLDISVVSVPGDPAAMVAGRALLGDDVELEEFFNQPNQPEPARSIVRADRRIRELEKRKRG